MRLGGLWDRAEALDAWLRPPSAIDFPWPHFELVAATTTGLYLCTRNRWQPLLAGRHDAVALADDALFCFQAGLGRGRIRRIGQDGRCRTAASGMTDSRHYLGAWEGRLYAADARQIRVFDLSSFEETDLLPFVGGGLDGIAFHDGRTYAVGEFSGASAVVIGDRAFRPEHTIPLEATGAAGIAFRGERMLVCDRGGRRLIDATGPVALFDGVPRALAVSSDGVVVGLTDASGTRLVFLDHRFQPTDTLALPGKVRDVRALTGWGAGR